MLVKLFSDGACSGNGKEGNTPGGYGTILQAFNNGKIVGEREFSQGYINTTNNRMELLGVITGLKNLNKPCEIIVISDSKYVVDAFNQNWVSGWLKNNWVNSQRKPVKNKDLWLELLELMKPHNVKFQWVKGHNEHPENERCDRLAVAAYNSDNLIEDSGYTP